MKKLSSLSIFFPCLNDGKILPYLLTKTYALAPKVARDFEVIIIENGSQDDTLQILSLLENQYKSLRVFRFKKPLGFGGALKQGFAKSKKDWIFYTNGDGQYDPLELPKLVEKCKVGIDIVYGYRIKRGDQAYRGFFGNIYRWFIKKRFSLPVRDVNCDFRLMRRSIMNKITLESNSGTIHLELILKLHDFSKKFTEVGVSHFPRPIGKSEFFRLPHLLKTFQDYWYFTIPSKPNR